MTAVDRFVRCTQGVTSVETALLSAVLTGLLLTAGPTIGDRLSAGFTAVAGSFRCTQADACGGEAVTRRWDGGDWSRGMASTRD